MVKKLKGGGNTMNRNNRIEPETTIIAEPIHDNIQVQNITRRNNRIVPVPIAQPVRIQAQNVINFDDLHHDIEQLEIYRNNYYHYLPQVRGSQRIEMLNSIRDIDNRIAIINHIINNANIIHGGFFNPIKAIQNTYNKTKNFLISGSQKFTTKVQNILKQVGNENINSIVIGRSPIPSMVQKALQVASFNNIPYDTLFHLYVIINGHILLEKNSVINMQINPSLPKDSQYMQANVPSNTNINTFIENCLKSMGDQKFYSYSSYGNNCQNFVINLLNSNGILTNELNNFVKQSTESIFENSPNLRRLANNLTDIDARTRYIVGGTLQKQCVKKLNLDQLLSLIDQETGQVKALGLHPEINDLIHERIRFILNNTGAPKVTSRKRI